MGVGESVSVALAARASVSPRDAKRVRRGGSPLSSRGSFLSHRNEPHALLSCPRQVADLWNLFDLFVVVSTDVSLAARAVGGSLGALGTLAMIARACRVARMLRIVRGYKEMRRLFNTLLFTLPGFANVGGLLS